MSNLAQWLRDPMTEKLLSVFKDRKVALESMILHGVASLESYRGYCGEHKGVGLLDIFIDAERRIDEES